MEARDQSAPGLRLFRVVGCAMACDLLRLPVDGRPSRRRRPALGATLALANHAKQAYYWMVACFRRSANQFPFEKRRQ
jgi:hypothetical protein